MTKKKKKSEDFSETRRWVWSLNNNTRMNKPYENRNIEERSNRE